ncbi:MAG: UrcA family protein [Gammaproteobacteria bacterium]|nr:UrcA family protein [Gammaproteobacteria bacterium]
MTGNIYITGGALALLLVGLSAAVGPAHANTEAQSGAYETITVTAPRITIEPGTPGVSKVITAEKNALVAFSDLDLSRTADLQALEERVRDAAEGICRDLSGEMPFGQPSTSVCVRRAVDDAMQQVRQATLVALAE